jgi:hypothetical protein
MKKLLGIAVVLAFQASIAFAQIIDCDRLTDPNYYLYLGENYSESEIMQGVERCFQQEMGEREPRQPAPSKPRTSRRGFNTNNCIHYRDEIGLNGPEVYVRNSCGRTKDVNVCLTFSDEPSFSARHNSVRLDAGGTWSFGFFRSGDYRFKYALRWCDPNNTTRTDICKAQCPGWK